MNSSTNTDDSHFLESESSLISPVCALKKMSVTVNTGHKLLTNTILVTFDSKEHVAKGWLAF